LTRPGRGFIIAGARDASFSQNGKRDMIKSALFVAFANI